MYTYAEIVNELLAEFPEISKNYEEEITWIKDTFQGQDTEGQTVYFDRCFCDYIRRLLVDESQDDIKIEKIFAFLEDMAVSEDQEVRNLLQVTVLEYLRSWYLLQNESEKRMLPETKKIFDRVKSYLEEPAQDVLPCFL
ncbi:hypothetical protein [uncultured Acetatifactor sp.]|jgi:hypothetical protein|uniref:DUF7674 family protein n=1 Tax=uncultured Acetatifactor sp. TaxID=1671927 RepID=UPI002630525D|nr:hypothetical protein [uncultured Acetatifactor sp.]